VFVCVGVCGGGVYVYLGNDRKFAPLSVTATHGTVTGYNPEIKNVEMWGIQHTQSVFSDLHTYLMNTLQDNKCL